MRYRATYVIYLLFWNGIICCLHICISIAGEFVEWRRSTMKGRRKVIVSTKRLKYDFELRRNLTIIRGDSATGKTTLIDMIRDHVNTPTWTPVELSCDKKCYVLEGALWKGQLDEISDSIVFIDEGNEFIKTEEFAGSIQKTDNYYVIVSRESLPTLPYKMWIYEWKVQYFPLSEYPQKQKDTCNSWWGCIWFWNWPGAPINFNSKFSWERFFTAVLINQTKDIYLAYAKRKLNPAYLNDTIKEIILAQMPEIRLN